MKKLIFVVLTVLLSTFMYAQPYTMIKGGAQLSKFS